MSTKLPHYWVNGHVDAHLSLDDRGLAYGDGVFETCRIRHGRIPLWQYHRARLLAGAAVLKLNVCTSDIEAQIDNALASVNVDDAIIKIIITRASVGRGYKSLPDAGVNVVISISAANAIQANPFWKKGLGVRICRHRLAAQGVLAGVKHLNRLDQVLARLEWQDQYDDGILLDYDEQMIESVSGNLLLVSNGQIITPSLTHSGVKGVMREYLGGQFGGFVERACPLSSLSQVDEIVIINAVVGALPVSHLSHEETIIWESRSTQAVELLQAHLVSGTFL